MYLAWEYNCRVQHRSCDVQINARRYEHVNWIILFSFGHEVGPVSALFLTSW
jgi:hypothetical protein